MFADRLEEQIQRTGTPLCVGLDPVIDLMAPPFLSGRRAPPYRRNDFEESAAILTRFGESVLEAVYPHVGVVKVQSACFERYGAHGVGALERVISMAKERELLVILDAKRSGIELGAEEDDAACLHHEGPLDVDALTVSPYLGEESLQPFFSAALASGRGVFVHARSAHLDAQTIQSARVGDSTVAEVVAGWVDRWASRWTGTSGFSSIGLVVGTSSADEARRLRRAAPRSLFLLPGVGQQPGPLPTIRSCMSADGGGVLVNVSRIVSYPHLFTDCSEDPVIAVREATRTFARALSRAMTW